MSQAIEWSELHRDGVSQAGRRLAALNPEYVPIDERSIRDLLAFARAYAGELNFFSVENDEVAIEGTWESFFSDVDLDLAVKYLHDPESFSQEAAQPFARPHFALFLVFLNLLRRVQGKLNGITKRHLDYYYGEVLGLERRGTIGDRIDVIFQLAPQIRHYMLPAGTLLRAGEDEQGNPRIYRTEKDINLNQAQVARLHNLFAETSTINLADVWLDTKISFEVAAIRLFELALGDPKPGDPLPLYPVQADEYAYLPDEERQIRALLDLTAVQQLIDFVPRSLYLSFNDYRTFTEHKRRFDLAFDQGSGWDLINRILEKAHQNKIAATGISYRFEISNPKDFQANLKNALNLSEEQIEDLFDGIAGVVTLKDAYNQRYDPVVQEKIRSNLFLPTDDADSNGADGLNFLALMQELIPIESNWQAIIRILAKARETRFKVADDLEAFELPEEELKIDEYNRIEDLIGKFLEFGPKIPFPSSFTGHAIEDLDSYEKHLEAVEGYFWMPAEDVHFLLGSLLFQHSRRTGDEEDGADELWVIQRRLDERWQKISSIFRKAHKNKVLAERKANLQAVRESATDGFDSMLGFAMGIADTADSRSPLDFLDQYALTEADIRFLGEMRASENLISDEDPRWKKVYEIAERIQRTILPEPLPQIVSWQNLYAYEDANEIGPSIVLDGKDEISHWKTFGRAIKSGIEFQGELGWAISSPVLELQQGMRTIVLTLGFAEAGFAIDELKELFAERGTFPFRIDVSTAAGWKALDLEVSLAKHVVGDFWNPETVDAPQSTEPLRVIQLHISIDESIDPLKSPPIRDNHYNAEWPVLRLLMKAVDSDARDPSEYAMPYPLFKNLVLRRVHIKVEIENLRPSYIRNDDGVVDATQPFEPFGAYPTVGSSFDLGHPELFCKDIDSLSFAIEWINWPDPINEYYANYDKSGQGTITGNNVFNVDISLCMGQHSHLLLAAATLFDPPAITPPDNVTWKSSVLVVDTFREWDRYIHWELNTPDFQHARYPARAAQLAVGLAAAMSRGAVSEGEAKKYEINPPYTPKINRLTLRYSSTLDIDLAENQVEATNSRLFHIHPFGYAEFLPSANSRATKFLPQYDNEGELYIGISNVEAPQTLSLLIQMAEGSADPNLTPEPVHWHYLSGNQWLSLAEGQILDDGTRGLVNSGIIQFELKSVAASTLLDPDLYWLRASVTRNANSIGDIIDIHAQAISATLEDSDNSKAHLSYRLPPETVTGLMMSDSRVAAVTQPYPSHGGRMGEDDEAFYARASERLRHKNRAVAQWDYEHLILERFPQIYKAKCLPATAANSGRVSVIVVPDVRHNALFDPFQPQAPISLLADIEGYLTKLTSIHAQVSVRNPNYVPVKLRLSVRFQPGIDENHAQLRLNEDINRFLSPWAFDAGKDIVIGGRIYANVIVSLIEELAYVDFVASVRLFKRENGRSFTPIQRLGTEGYWVEPETSDGVLVAARSHEIDIVTEADYEEEDLIGIEYMQIELDFVVGA